MDLNRFILEHIDFNSIVEDSLIYNCLHTGSQFISFWPLDSFTTPFYIRLNEFAILLWNKLK